MVELLGPKHPRERLAHTVGCVAVECGGRDSLVKLVSLLGSGPQHFLEVAAEWAVRAVNSLEVGRTDAAQAQARKRDVRLRLL